LSGERLSWAERAESVNAAFPNVPPTVYSHKWLYGVWYCGKRWTKNVLWGQYPNRFHERSLALWPDIPPLEILHACAGTLTGPGVTLDISRQFQPQVQADVQHLPFKDDSFSLILYDPPYSDADANRYGQPKAPSWGKVWPEFLRILKPGGHIGVLHTYYPSYRRDEVNLRGLIAVVTGFMSVTRMFSIFEANANGKLL